MGGSNESEKINFANDLIRRLGLKDVHSKTLKNLPKDQVIAVLKPFFEKMNLREDEKLDRNFIDETLVNELNDQVNKSITTVEHQNKWKNLVVPICDALFTINSEPQDQISSAIAAIKSSFGEDAEKRPPERPMKKREGTAQNTLDKLKAAAELDNTDTIRATYERPNLDEFGDIPPPPPLPDDESQTPDPEPLGASPKPSPNNKPN